MHLSHSYKGWVYDATAGLTLREVQLHPLKAGWLRCHVLRTQPSITDVMVVQRQLGTSEPHSAARPLGHEFVATVVSVAPPADPTWQGKRVVCPPRTPCGACSECRRSSPNLCRAPFRIGRDTGGGMAEVIDLPAAVVHMVPEEVSDAAACCSQPAASAVANLAHVGLEPGTRVIILGQGTMGLLLLQAARAQGASAVATTAPRESVRRLSESLGAVMSIPPDAPTTAERLREFNADLVIDAAGGSRAVGLAGTATLEQAMDVVRPYGTVLEVSDLTEPLLLDPLLRRKAIRLVFGQMGYYMGLYAHALQLLADGRLRCEPLVTHEVVGLNRLPEALAIMTDRQRTGAIQVQVVV